MVSEFRRLFVPEAVIRPTLAGQLAFMTVAYGLSGLLWWAISGKAWVAVLTLSAQAGGPALFALLGVVFARPHWAHPVREFDPRRVLVWAYFTGALLAAVAVVLPTVVRG